MTPDAREPSAMPLLLVVMTVATFVGLLLIIGFLNIPAWWLLPVTVGSVVVGTVLVLGAFLKTLADEDGRIGTPRSG